MMAEKGLESLQVWQKARELTVVVCHEILPTIPDKERYALTQQLRCAVQSIPANNAEAHGRYHYQDRMRFCYIARGSLDETLSHLLIAHDLGYVNEGTLKPIREIWQDTYRLLNGYIDYLRRIQHEYKLSGLRDGDQLGEYNFINPDP